MNGAIYEQEGKRELGRGDVVRVEPGVGVEGAAVDEAELRKTRSSFFELTKVSGRPDRQANLVSLANQKLIDR
jgi:hypothetical protein